MRTSAPAALSCCLTILNSLPQTASQHLEGVGSDDHGHHQRLAVLLPSPPSGRHDGQWPTGCSPAGETTRKANPGNANSPSTKMLYSAFLDQGVHSQLSEYNALATIPSWDKDAATANDFSVDALYDMAFPLHAPENRFWVKTLSLGGGSSKLRGVLDQSSGGGDGASIYNNDDEAFAHFVRAASERQRLQKQRWGESAPSRSFDEALAVSLKDPRYERRASLFTTASTPPASGDFGEESTIVRATTARTLRELSGDWKKYKHRRKWKGDPKHGVEPKWKAQQKWKGNPKHGVEPKWKAQQKWKGNPKSGVEPKWRAEKKWKTKFCAPECERTSKDGTKGRVCDISCDSGEPYGKKGCSAKGGKYGMFCRVCYNDMRRAMQADRPDDRAIMCDTLEPPSVYSKPGLGVPEELPKYCTPECERTSKDGTRGRVCDISCDSGEPYGKKGCSAKGGEYGMFCRTCYNDIRMAMRADSPDDRAIMCDNLEPPSVYSKRSLVAEETRNHLPRPSAASELADPLLVLKREHDANTV
eukprot:g13529.t1